MSARTFFGISGNEAQMLRKAQQVVQHDMNYKKLHKE